MSCDELALVPLPFMVTCMVSISKSLCTLAAFWLVCAWWGGTSHVLHVVMSQLLGVLKRSRSCAVWKKKQVKSTQSTWPYSFNPILWGVAPMLVRRTHSNWNNSLWLPISRWFNSVFVSLSVPKYPYILVENPGKAQISSSNIFSNYLHYYWWLVQFNRYYLQMKLCPIIVT